MISDSVRINFRFFVFAVALLACSMLNCGGGFADDNENSSEFINTIFHPDKIDTSDSR